MLLVPKKKCFVTKWGVGYPPLKFITTTLPLSLDFLASILSIVSLISDLFKMIKHQLPTKILSINPPAHNSTLLPPAEMRTCPQPIRLRLCLIWKAAQFCLRDWDLNWLPKLKSWYQDVKTIWHLQGFSFRCRHVNLGGRGKNIAMNASAVPDRRKFWIEEIV